MASKLPWEPAAFLNFTITMPTTTPRGMARDKTTALNVKEAVVRRWREKKIPTASVARSWWKRMEVERCRVVQKASIKPTESPSKIECVVMETRRVKHLVERGGGVVGFYEVWGWVSWGVGFCGWGENFWGGMFVGYLGGMLG